MSATREETEARALLKEVGAKFLRDSGNSHEMWELPNGRTFTCNKEGRGKGKAWKNNLAQLRRLLNGTEPKRGPEPEPSDPAAAEAALRRNSAVKKKQKRKAPTPHPNAVEAPAPARPRLGKPFSDESLAIMKRMLHDDEPWDAILEEVRKVRPNTSMGSLKSKARKEFYRRPKQWETPKVPKMPKTKRNGAAWTPQEDADLLGYADSGASYDEISEVMGGRTPSAIQNRLSKLRRNAKTAPPSQTPTPPTVSAPSAPPRIEEQVNGYELVLRFPDGRETKAPIPKRKAEEWALRLISGDY